MPLAPSKTTLPPSRISRAQTRRRANPPPGLYDPLTGLPNRRLLLDRLHQALLNSERHGRHAAVLFIDLDNFKSLNDTQGHDVGDLLLVEVAARLKQCVRIPPTPWRAGRR